MADYRDVIYDTLKRVAEDEHLELPPLSDDKSLVDELGFRSLHIARILAILEIELDVDPFASGELPITNVRTVGDLCNAYAGAD